MSGQFGSISQKEKLQLEAIPSEEKKRERERNGLKLLHLDDDSFFEWHLFSAVSSPVLPGERTKPFIGARRDPGPKAAAVIKLKNRVHTCPEGILGHELAYSPPPSALTPTTFSFSQKKKQDVAP